MIKNPVLLFICVLFIQCSAAKPKLNVLPGATQTQIYFPLLKDHKIGVVANQTSLVGRVHLVDTLKNTGFDVKYVFAPEHGFRGNKSAGEEFRDSVDSATGIPVVSLYGSKYKPSKEEMKKIDLMVFDIQDVGVRFFTYISTLQYCMEACAENNVKLIVLDRPNPNGFYVDGPVLEPKYSSFIGKQPVPVVYGMTIGEYAMMLNGEGWLSDKKKCDLEVIKIANYYHRAEYALPKPPSPNLPNMDAIYLYPSVCFFEGTRVSLGRGTDKPFRLIGFPEFNIAWSAKSDSSDTTKSNPYRAALSFQPVNIPGVAVNPPYQDTLCYGIDLSKEGLAILKQPGIKLKWLLAMYAAYPDKRKFFTPFFEKLAGTEELRKQIEAGKTEEEIKASWQPGIDRFKKIRKKYLLYTDFEK